MSQEQPQPSSPTAGVIYTIGVGELLAEHLCRRLESLEVEFVIDVRSPPFSIDRPDLYPSQLERVFTEHELRYVNMSDQLGDRPKDVSVYTRGGQRVDYRKCRQRDWAKEGLSRLLKAYQLGLRICLLGRHPDPCHSHVARFIGEAIWDEHQIEARHLMASGSWSTQNDIRQLLARWGQELHLSSEDDL